MSNPFDRGEFDFTLTGRLLHEAGDVRCPICDQTFTEGEVIDTLMPWRFDGKVYILRTHQRCKVTATT